MDQRGRELNRFLVEVFYEILRTEEDCLSTDYKDLSLRELHLIEEVCLAADEGLDNRSTAIAAAQRVTAGTLTTAVTLLERKGYLERRRDSRDKRVVRILPTPLGRAAAAHHAAFHRDLVENLLAALPEDEIPVLLRGLSSVSAFFRARGAATPAGKKKEIEV